MSSGSTHMVIGGVGGMALAVGLAHWAPDVIRTAETTVPAWPGLTQISAVVPGGITGAVLVIVSAVLATWPDIDTGESFMARRVRFVMTIFGGALGLLIAWGIGVTRAAAAAGALRQGALEPASTLTFVAVACILGGALLGALLGDWLLRLIRTAAGGHRHLTHSLVLSVPLAALAAGLFLAGLPLWALVPAAIAWGQWLHLAGDVPTTQGVYLLHPIWGGTVRVLPYPVCKAGELIVFCLSVVIGFVLVRMA